MLSFLQLPLDIHLEIASLLDAPDLRRLALASNHLVAPVYDVLYRSVDLYLPRPEGGGVRDIQVDRYKQIRMLCFLRTVIERPDLARKVRSIRLGVYGGRICHWRNPWRGIMRGFEQDDVHRAVMKAWESVKSPMQKDTDGALSTVFSNDPPNCYGTCDKCNQESLCRYVEEMLTRKMTDAYYYVLTRMLWNLCEIDLVGSFYHVRPCETCPAMVGVPAAYPNVRSLSINYRNLPVSPPWSPRLRELRLRCQGSTLASYAWISQLYAFPTPLLQSLTLEIPLFRGFVDDLDRPLHLHQAVSEECQTFRGWLLGLAGYLQCANLRRLELIMRSAPPVPGGADFQGMTDVIMSTFPNIQELALSPSYSLYYDRTFILPSRRIKRLNSPAKLRRLTLTQLLLEDGRNAHDPGYGHGEALYASVSYSRAPVGGFDLHTYDEANRSVFGDQDPNSVPYHYPIIQAQYSNLLSLDLWVHSASPSTIAFFHELQAARDHHPSLRYVNVCVPVADDIPYDAIKAGLRRFVAMFRAEGILLRFSRRSLWPTEDDHRKDVVRAEREDHRLAVRRSRVGAPRHVHVVPWPPGRRRYYGPAPEPLSEETVEEVWTAIRELVG